MKTILIVIAHGSRNEGSNTEVRELCGRLAEVASTDHVMPAFLELAEPSLSATVDSAVNAGADRILVLPYFLNSGRHVTRDVPALVSTARSEHPGMSIDLLPHIGGTDVFFSAMESIVRRQGRQED